MIDNDCCLVGFWACPLKIQWDEDLVDWGRSSHFRKQTVNYVHWFYCTVCPCWLIARSSSTGCSFSARHGWKNKPYLKTRAFLLRPAVNHPMCFGVVASRSARALAYVLMSNVIGVCIRFGGVGGNNVLPSAYLGDATFFNSRYFSSFQHNNSCYAARICFFYFSNIIVCYTQKIFSSTISNIFRCYAF